jgi:hypothetical protein
VTHSIARSFVMVSAPRDFMKAMNSDNRFAGSSYYIPALGASDVALKRGAKPAHWTPPGQGRLSSRSFSISSLA